ncbi:hypothetical protein CAI21_20220 [Alkalilimnicola ehrlichii]|uniref:Outer membrane lipoprotein Slp n=1 Tax=Alkalilimnicola ehrlichii TaxID=351052 RepID=A0A3E0WJB5_9GAMM|nr:Slp family lipoprotein [Alkalilimnicola ehrlichii]RFA24797.1 hypothetical protein CAI21_20220 [Alkalilimnicola ehrlichii]RFA32056.1 hypothetical protein CAL65_20680 [Alkalilimnicola ehrlichii]
MRQVSGCFLLLLLLLLMLGLAACATGPGFDRAGVDTDIMPPRAVAEMDARQGERVIWGGTVINVRNLEDRTRLEILAYPLDRSQRPRTGASAAGRFLVDYPGYLETADYGSGREVTVVGELLREQRGKVGDAEYRYPLVAAEDVYLWPREPVREQPRVRFGIGVMLSR